MINSGAGYPQRHRTPSHHWKCTHIPYTVDTPQNAQAGAWSQQRFCHSQIITGREKTHNNQVPQDNLEKQLPSHLQDFNWPLPSVHNLDTYHPASMTEHDGARTRTDWRSHRPRPRVTNCSHNTQSHMSVVARPLSLALSSPTDCSRFIFDLLV